ncbi:hypothetical protein [Sediminivirga luteola]|nr:hypothetical protein [Sediminivirga luteola]MCI2264177.1 hypothetical protein [Sediminivirga luteola]
MPPTTPATAPATGPAVAPVILRPGPQPDGTGGLDTLQLESLRLDGLLRRIAPRCWAGREAVLTPALKAGVVEFPPLRDLAVSHASAAWVWWGEDEAPAPWEFSTLNRRRVRGQRECTVHEATVAPDDLAHPGGVPVTGPVRTLVDLLHATAADGDGDAGLPRAAEEAPAVARRAARDAIDRMSRRPHLRAMRALAGRLASG